MSIELETDRRVAPPQPSRSARIGDGTIHVFDGLFDDEETTQFGKIIAQLEYTRRPSFDNELSYVIPPDSFTRAPFLYQDTERLIAHYGRAMKADPEAVVGLSHVYAAAVAPAVQTEIHRDMVCRDCLTFLYYGNIVWKPDWAGETIFYDDDGDTAHAVLPRPGRLVLFNSTLRHRTGVPQRDCPSYRYTVSVFYYCWEHNPRLRGEPVPDD